MGIRVHARTLSDGHGHAEEHAVGGGQMTLGPPISGSYKRNQPGGVDNAPSDGDGTNRRGRSRRRCRVIHLSGIECEKAPRPLVAFSVVHSGTTLAGSHIEFRTCDSDGQCGA